MPISLAAMLSISSAAELNPAAVVYKLPDQIPWSTPDARGVQNAVVVGDPSKPGFYVVFTKWLKGNHFGKQEHWDGAKDEDAVLMIMGEGPATSTAAEEK
jgi:hypothetical protein